ncbi:MAG: hypothetical protein R2699_13975 [Acidimicrobiales bacterium]
MPGTRMLVMDYADFHAMDYLAGASTVYTGGVCQSAGFLVRRAAHRAQAPGRIDVYGVSRAGVVCRAPPRTRPDTAQASTVTAIPMSGSPILNGAYAPVTPLAVGAGERLSLRATGGPTGAALGAIVQYFDAKPQLNLHSTRCGGCTTRAAASPRTA